MPREFEKPKGEEEYLRLVERLAKAVVEEAVVEEAFEVFLDVGTKTPLQAAISRLARVVKFQHDTDDDCST